jgi:hypothetical protein
MVDKLADPLVAEHADFIRLFSEQGACTRCIFVLLQIDSISEYRHHANTTLEAHVDGYKEPEVCSICSGVLQNAECTADKIA